MSQLEIGFVTKSDRYFYDGLVALLASLKTWHPSSPITVVDCGLTDTQAQKVRKCPNVSLIGHGGMGFNIPLSMQHYYTPAIYGFFSIHDDLYPLTVHIDADAVVLASLNELVLLAQSSDVGISAVPDYPNLNLQYQLGDINGAYAALKSVVNEPQLDSISFNGGVFALRSEYYYEHMRPWVDRLIPHHELFWGNDMAIMNFAAYAANRTLPFNILPHSFNTRASYRRASELQFNRIVEWKSGLPILEGPFGRINILHFVGKNKPWNPIACSNDSLFTWQHYRDLGAHLFE